MISRLIKLNQHYHTSFYTYPLFQNKFFVYFPTKFFSTSIRRMSSSPPSISDVILGSFAADSVALGAHWEYNTDNIKSKFGELSSLQAPIKDYHKGKEAGDQTHFGDTAIFLLQSLTKSKDHKFDADIYSKHLVESWENHHGYKDHATTGTIKNIKEGKSGISAASTDDDFGHSSKFFPLLAIYDSENELVSATRSLVSVQQSNDNNILTGEFLARVIFRIYHSRVTPIEAVKSVTSELKNDWLTNLVNSGLNSASESDSDYIHGLGEVKTFGSNKVYTGLTCSINFGVPAYVHYLVKYSNELPSTAVIHDINLGGNSAARSIAIATSLISYKGINNDSKFKEWINGLKRKGEIEQLLSQIGVKSS